MRVLTYCHCVKLAYWHIYCNILKPFHTKRESEYVSFETRVITIIIEEYLMQFSLRRKVIARLSGVVAFFGVPGLALATISSALPTDNWRVHYVDSEETTAVYRPAVNAFDGNLKTYWFTQWSVNKDPLPHELRIDLGDIFDVEAFSYTARQDEQHGRIVGYEFFVSMDGTNWGAPVSSGRLQNTSAKQTIRFAMTSGRYVRLRALEEANGKYFTSIAELGLLGRPYSGDSAVTVASLTVESKPKTVTNINTSPAAADTLGASNNNAAVDWSEVISRSTGRLHFVSSAADFNDKAANARPGDVILIKNGRYRYWRLAMPANGTADKPIVIAAQTPGSVVFGEGTRLKITGNHYIIGGFVFENLSRNNSILFEGASNNRFTDNRFSNCGLTPTDRILGVYDGSNRNRFDHNIMIGSRSIGMAVVLPKDGDYSFRYSQDNRFDHNTFRDIPSQQSPQHAMALQIGQYATKHNRDESRTLIDNNRFTNNGAEAVNSKSNNEIYRNNVFRDSTRFSSLVLRSGNDKRIISNEFENVKIAIQAYGKGHVISKNEIRTVREAGILVPRWGTYQIDASRLSTSPSTGDISITENLVENSANRGIEIGRTWGWVTKPGYVLAENPPFGLKVERNTLIGTKGILLHDRGALNPIIRSNRYVLGGTASAGTLGTDAIVSYQ